MVDEKSFFCEQKYERKKIRSGCHLPGKSCCFSSLLTLLRKEVSLPSQSIDTSFFSGFKTTCPNLEGELAVSLHASGFISNICKGLVPGGGGGGILSTGLDSGVGKLYIALHKGAGVLHKASGMGLFGDGLGSGVGILSSGLVSGVDALCSGLGIKVGWLYK